MHNMQMVFNELSLTPPAPNLHVARERAENFVLTMREATVRGVPRVLRTQEDFYEALLASDYRWVQWRNDSNVDRELRGFFKSLTHKMPLLVDEPVKDQIMQGLECRLAGRVALGLGVAYSLEGLGLSLLSEELWDAAWLPLDVTALEDDGSLSENSRPVAHASQVDHVRQHFQRALHDLDEVAHWNEAQSDEAAEAVVHLQVERQQLHGIAPAAVPEEYTQGLQAENNVFRFRLGAGFRQSLRQNAKLSIALVLDACSRIILGNPKEAVNPFRVDERPQSPQRARANDSALAWRTHLARANEGFRLMFWTTPTGEIEFANVGTKKELLIHE